MLLHRGWSVDTEVSHENIRLEFFWGYLLPYGDGHHSQMRTNSNEVSSDMNIIWRSTFQLRF